MKIQVLVATMNQSDYSLPEKMNLCTDAIVSNQCDRNSVEKVTFRKKEIQYLNFAERGVGLNRNNALMRATGDICLFADDDMVYVDNYDKLVEKAFIENKNADVIIFNLIEKNPTRFIIQRPTKVGYFNYLRYGTARIAIRLKSIKENGIYFNQCFGGGTEHCHGEDNIFLNTCLKKHLKLIAVPVFIAELTEERASSWNQGYDEKYLKDQGFLYYTLTKKWWKILCLQDAIRRHSYYSVSWKDAYKIMTKSNILKGF